MLNRRPTQADVAKLAGVSQAAVSQVLNRNDFAIPEETQQRILNAIRELGYVPNKSAQSLRTQKAYTIASIIPDITNPFYPAFQRGIQSVTSQHNYDLIVYDTDEKMENEERSLRSLVSAGVDGAIVSLFHHDREDLRPLIEKNIPVVEWNGSTTMDENLIIDTIFVDNVAIAKKSVSYLIEKGHTRIGMIAGLENSPPAQFRVRGYRKALNEKNMPVDENLIQVGGFSEEGGYQGMKKLLALSLRPTAVFASNDLMALGAIIAIREENLQIPKDIALIGLDDIPAAKLVHPTLTTSTQMQENVGRRAAEMLFERINGIAPAKPRIEEMPFKFIIRESA
jgi:LacI family transcriptional regulator